MPLDPSISLQTVNPNPTNYISSFIDLGQKKLNLDKSRQTFDADVAQRQADSQTAQAGAQVATANVQPLIAQQAAQTSMAQSGATAATNRITADQAAIAFKQAGGLMGDPAVIAGKDPDAVAKAVLGAKQRAIDSGLDPFKAEVMFGKLVTQAHDNPGGFRAQLNNLVSGQMDAGSQQGAAFPAPTPVATSTGTKFAATGNPALTGTPAGTLGAAPAIPPPNSIVTDTTGAPVIANPATGVARPFAPAAPPGVSAPQMSLPPGETTQTQQGLQAERDAAKGVALNAPQMHDINRSIVAEVDKGVTTGTLGGLIQKVRSATGYVPGAGEESGTDYNVLGKMLERSALTAAQGMGPHTNAGLEAQVRANGSTDYTPQAIRKIANLNDALTTGATLYQAGVEAAIQQSGSVFGKRQFDQQWSNVMNPSGGVNGVQALRLKNAIDNGDTKERDAVLSEIGGKGSPKAAALLSKLQALQKLAGQ